MCSVHSDESNRELGKSSRTFLLPKAPSIRRSSVEEAVVRITELENEITTSIAQLMRLKTEIAEAIRSMNSMECEPLLEMRYLTFLGWDQIAAQLKYS